MNFISVLLTFIIIILIIYIFCHYFYSNNKENFYSNGNTTMGYSTLSRKTPQFTAIPNILTAIGGIKGKNYTGSVGLYPSDRNHLKTGAPYLNKNKRTIIRPELVGFSANSFVNRDTYSDFYNHVGERKKSPDFRYVTKLNGLNLNPSRYSTPQYRFSSI
jgi:hypothetical protein